MQTSMIGEPHSRTVKFYLCLYCSDRYQIMLLLLPPQCQNMTPYADRPAKISLVPDVVLFGFQDENQA